MMTMAQFAEHTRSHHVANLDATKKAYRTDSKYVTCEERDLSLVPEVPHPLPSSGSPPHALCQPPSYPCPGTAAPPWVWLAWCSGAVSGLKCPLCWLLMKTVGQNSRFCTTGSVF